MMAKCVFVVTGAEAKEACGTEQLCGGLEVGIEGGTHMVRLLWKYHAQEEDWGFLLIDTCNVFNEENRTAIIWSVQHKWPSDARFAFNWYRHLATLVMRGWDVTGRFIYSKEEVTQVDELAMVAYRLGILPLIQYLRTAHPSVTHLWYTDDAGVGCTFRVILRHLEDLMVRGTLQGYFPKPTKFVSPWNIPQAKAFFCGYSLQIVTGGRCFGGIVRKKATRDSWLGEKV